ncbi:bifunctional nicotinamidase/pyrazinamidase [Roseomonas sp. BN140053]|uniref:bifunctional nicotinamidase/pyrazinamidase n=1 Tax=Roseomonas sp. BN140053 TaxID=3391898 RepID=UPI0039EA71F4
MMRLDPESDVLIVVDVQPDFMPGGALPVPDGDAVVPVANRLLAHFAQAVATQDWHPPGHLSFASQHPGVPPFGTVRLPYGEQTVWPDHCLIGSPGAALHPGLDQARLRAVFRKGFRRAVDSYSGFVENDRVTRTGLDGYLREVGAKRVFLCGLATDFCVAATALGAAERGFETLVVSDACRAIAAPLPDGSSTLEAAWTALQAAGVRTVQSQELHGGGEPGSPSA